MLDWCLCIQTDDYCLQAMKYQTSMSVAPSTTPTDEPSKTWAARILLGGKKNGGKARGPLSVEEEINEYLQAKLLDPTSNILRYWQVGFFLL